jgi:hypothetical protein
VHAVRLAEQAPADDLQRDPGQAGPDNRCLLTLNTGDGISEKILDIGTSEWVQPSNAFWAALGYTGNVLAYLEGKWVTAAAFLKLFGLSNPPSSGGTCSTLSPTGIPVTGWTLVRTVKLSGRLAWRIINRNKGVSAYVSDEYFSDYNAPIMLAPPLNTYVLTTVPPPPGGSPSVGADIRSPAGSTARSGLLVRASLPDRGGLPGPLLF